MVVLLRVMGFVLRSREGFSKLPVKSLHIDVPVLALPFPKCHHEFLSVCGSQSEGKENATAPGCGSARLPRDSPRSGRLLI